MGMSLKDAERWLSGISVQTEVDMDVTVGAAIMQLFGNVGFEYVLGLLLGEKQGLMLQLANLNLGDDLQRNLASVTQGKIKGIDRLRETLLEIVEATAPSPTEEKEPVNG